MEIKDVAEKLAWGLGGAALLEMIGRPKSAKVVLPVVGRLPTLAQGDPTKPGLLENLFASTTDPAAG